MTPQTQNKKQWFGFEDIIRTNTNEEIGQELYGNGTTSLWTEHIKLVNKMIEEENRAKAERRAKRLGICIEEEQERC